ncbi:MAG: hypothetical protein ACMUHB_06705, partial [Thermoplasmatota archaeon]
VQVRITDGEEMVSYNFNIDLVLNPSPYSILGVPANGSVITGSNATLVWEGYDPDDEVLAYDVYLSEVLSKIEDLTEEARIAEGVESSSLEVDELEAGETYYWTVIPTDEYSRGIATEGPFSFYVNTPPQTSKLGPASGMKVSTRGLELSWEGNDADGHDLQYDIYISEIEEDVTGLMESALKGDDILEERLLIEDLIPGKTYYWTVIPFDGFATGVCLSGHISLVTNTPPTIAPVLNMQAEAGKVFVYQFVGQDADEGDIQTLTFSLRNSLEGMQLFIPDTNDGTTTLSWTPGNDQVGDHNIVLVVTDGVDETNISFRIQVMTSQGETDEEDKDTLSPMVFILPVIGIFLIALFVVVLFLFLRSRKKTEVPEEPPDTGEEAGSIPPDTEIPPPEPEMESGSLAENEITSTETAASPVQPAAQPQVQPPGQTEVRQNIPPSVGESTSKPPAADAGQNMAEQDVRS